MQYVIQSGLWKLAQLFWLLFNNTVVPTPKGGFYFSQRTVPICRLMSNTCRLQNFKAKYSKVGKPTFKHPT
jgi:hypothetical protein